MTSKNDLKIGDVVYIFDINRRVYGQDTDGRSNSGPIYREHFAKYVIVDEIARSWMIAPNGEARFARKVSKNSNLLTEHDVDEQCWLNENRHKIIRVVESTHDIDKLRQIAAIVGYDG